MYTRYVYVLIIQCILIIWNKQKHNIIINTLMCLFRQVFTSLFININLSFFAMMTYYTFICVILVKMQKLKYTDSITSIIAPPYTNAWLTNSLLSSK